MLKLADNEDILYRRNINNTSFITTLIGFILLVSAITMLWLNEHDYAKNIEIVKFVKNNVISINSYNVSRLNNNKLIHTSDYAKTNESLTDGLVEIPNAIALKRDVQMYQWKEIKRIRTVDLGGGKQIKKPEHIYQNVWSKNLIQSDKFIKKEFHQNPKEFPINKNRINSKNVSLGRFLISKNHISEINSSKKITRLPANNQYKIYNGFYFNGIDFDSPAIGDVKISYSYVPTNIPVSIIAKQNENHLEPYKLKNNEISIISEGIKSSDEMINEYINDDTIKANLIRFGAFLMILIAIKLFSIHLIEISAQNPHFNKAVEYITGIAKTTMTLGIIGSTISIAWIQYRPEIAIFGLIASLCLIIFLPQKKHITLD